MGKQGLERKGAQEWVEVRPGLSQALSLPLEIITVGPEGL